MSNLELTYKRLQEERSRLMRIGTISTEMGHAYNQFVDGRISGLNLALSILNEEIKQHERLV